MSQRRFPNESVGEAVMPFRTGTLVGSLCVLAILSILLRGCSADSPSVSLDLVPVQGVVIREGKPIDLRPGDFGKVWFHPDTSKGNLAAETPAGDIALDGSYVLFTRGQAGAPAGWYRVALVINQRRTPNRPTKKRDSLIAEALADPSKSGLAIFVAANRAPGSFDIRI